MLPWVFALLATTSQAAPAPAAPTVDTRYIVRAWGTRTACRKTPSRRLSRPATGTSGSPPSAASSASTATPSPSSIPATPPVLRARGSSRSTRTQTARCGLARRARSTPGTTPSRASRPPSRSSPRSTSSPPGCAAGCSCRPTSPARARGRHPPASLPRRQGSDQQRDHARARVGNRAFVARGPRCADRRGGG